MDIHPFLYVAAILFCFGLATLAAKRNAIMMLMGVELMLNAANLNLVAFSRMFGHLHGHMFALFVMVVAAAEAAVALAIVLLVYKHFQHIRLDALNKLKN